MCPDKKRDPQRILAVLSRGLTQYGRISERQNRVFPCQSMVWQSLYNGFMLQYTINIATCFSNFEKQVAMELSA